MTAMSEKIPLHIVLEMRWMKFTSGARPWWKDASLLNALLLPIQETVFNDIPVALEMSSGKKRKQFARLQDVMAELVSAPDGVYIAVGGDPASPRNLKLFLEEETLAVELDFRIGKGHNEPSLRELTRMAVKLNHVALPLGAIGPIFSIRWFNHEYPRPLPPRFDARWPPGALAYYLSEKYYSQSGAERHATFILLKDTPMPEGIIRQQFDDLLVIQAAESWEQREHLAQQLYKLELWLGKLLNLKFDQNYQANGDKRTPIWSKEIVKPFSFYDAATRTGYKVVAENRDDELDEETWKELEEVLPLRALPDGRPVDVTRVILVEREAALSQLPKIRELGGNGVLYLGQDGDMWDPSPPGQWVPTNWDEV
jgi:hypothetical protein